MNQYLAADSLFFLDALDNIAGFQVQGDWISTIGDFVVETFDLGEGGLEAVLIRQRIQQAAFLGRNRLAYLPIEPHIAIVLPPW